MNQSEFAALRDASWKTGTKWEKAAQLGFAGNDVSDESCKRCKPSPVQRPSGCYPGCYPNRLR